MPWTSLKARDIPAFAQADGFVLGGTAWDFSNQERVPRGSLDLLVIDEAGQFSLASTIASAVAAQRLLLLGDPQQLPQVSQGTHPEPVDDSALGWLSDGHNVLPGELGYFLARSWRMHPQLCEAVSQLAYEGKLVSAAGPRQLESVAPGLHPIPVRHQFNSTSSVEEAGRAVEMARSLLGRAWTCDGVTHPLRQEDLIVVAPYNAQVELIRQRMRAAGMPLVPVGTVDKFQGQEAAVSIVSLAASSAAEVPRGLEFLLLPNRLNVAISRAQWAAYLLYSPELTEYLPTNVAALAHLSAFISLVEPTAEASPRGVPARYVMRVDCAKPGKTGQIRRRCVYPSVACANSGSVGGRVLTSGMEDSFEQRARIAELLAETEALDWDLDWHPDAPADSGVGWAAGPLVSTWIRTPAPIRPTPGASGLEGTDPVVRRWRIEQIVAGRAEIARLQALEARHLAALTDTVETNTEPGAGGERLEWAFRSLTAELAVACRVSSRTMQSRLAEAHLLVERFPATLTALQAGRIEAGHVRTIMLHGGSIDDPGRPGPVRGHRAAEGRPWSPRAGWPNTPN